MVGTRIQIGQDKAEVDQHAPKVRARRVIALRRGSNVGRSENL